MDKPSLLVDETILLYGDVGDPWCWGDGFTVADVAGALAEHGPGDITVRVNSGGGIAFDGIAIYSLLLAHAGKVTVVVDGIAASAASLIVMAGDVREIRDGAMMMIHDAAGVTFGTSADHQRSATVLDKLSDQYAGIYAKRAGIDQSAARDLMKAETWFDADEAVAQGFCTGKVEDLAEATASFDYRIYAHAPKSLPRRSKPKAAPAASLDTAKETPVTTQTTATTPAPKAWTTDFFTAAEESGLSVKSLLEIVAKVDTLEAATAAMTDAIAAAKVAADAAAAGKVEPAPPAPAAKAWTHQFFTAAENSGLALKALNEIVARAPTLEAAKDGLIDAMASHQSPNKPAPAAGHLGAGSGKDDKAGGILASYRKAGGRTREDVAAR
ncbi:Clp protease ClpP [Methylobacterium sp. E-041]|uniref:head maturation protease, ClpP-related n=1 Tax=Methylobacterium sp. E-041 TaxID=2836573 RepID=UPI001FBA7858|nr:head maturation protease, ClpP-related [Methylobacterium sp. E-041]MCJ2108036.1 Clp protease ClpP [Methylobacterium sp. E-041]